MPVFGVGVDIVHVPRIASTLARFGSRFLRKALHSQEIHALEAKPAHRAAEFVASRWAVKESVWKAAGGQRPLPFSELLLEHDSCGRPRLVAEGQAKVALAALGITDVQVALSHEREYAFATVLLQK